MRRRAFQIADAYRRGSKLYARNKEALEQARASAAAAPATIALHRESDSRRSVVTREDVVKRIANSTDGPQFSRNDATQPADAATMQRVQAVVDAIRAKWKNAPEVVVVSSLQDENVPEAVRRYDAQQRSLGAQGEPEGFHFGGKVYVLASQVPTGTRVHRERRIHGSAQGTDQHEKVPRYDGF